MVSAGRLDVNKSFSVFDVSRGLLFSLSLYVVLFCAFHHFLLLLILVMYLLLVCSRVALPCIFLFDHDLF